MAEIEKVGNKDETAYVIETFYRVKSVNSIQLFHTVLLCFMVGLLLTQLVFSTYGPTQECVCVDQKVVDQVQPVK